jgi:hypothetical protein
MGGVSSSQKAQTCKYSKQDFTTRINVIRDAHSVMQFYASILLREQMPATLPEYKNYSGASEEYFNTKRKENIQELVSLNPKIKNHYDFYNALTFLQTEYERRDITDNERKSKITNIFDISYVLLKFLVDDLSSSCEEQGMKPIKKEIKK